MSTATLEKPEALVQQKKIHLTFSTVKALGENQFQGIVATNSLDRHGEILDIKGLDIKQYLTNPVVLYGHDYQGLPIGRTTKLTKNKNGELVATFELATDVYPFAAQVAALMKAGFLNTLSIGFVPKEGDFHGDDFVYSKSEMVEFSVVPVPANAEAVITARSLGVEKAAKELLIAQHDEVENEILDPKTKWLNAIKAKIADLNATDATFFSGILSQINQVDVLVDQVDDAVDEILVNLSAYLGVPNPDTDAETDDANENNEVGEPGEAANTVRTGKALDNTSDLKEIDLSNVPDLIVALKNTTSALEAKYASAEPGDGARQVHKRKLVLGEAKKTAVAADKLVELIIAGLKKE